ncbi:putative secreted protein, xanthomonadin biosynthesis [Xanthomonas citri pv. fuscans]|nr:putative secreted protein, xanthomonadin biosynthesis [Xanthomonas citri pv. fuscans]
MVAPIVSENITPFAAEERTSPMTTDAARAATPLRVEGHYRRPDAQTLVREVSAPYRETTTLTGDEGVLEREGKSPRRFSLSRVPELAGLKSGLGALLSGDRALLEQHYRVSGQGQPQAWQLTLQPKDAAVARQVHELRLYGRNDELRCIESVPARGDMQRTLLGAAAREATGIIDASALTTLCHGSGA